MRKQTSLLLSFIAATVLFTAPLLAQDIKTDYNHSTNFSQFHTFSFGRIHASDQLYSDRIKDEVTRDLTSRGWQLVPSGGDVVVTAIGGMKDQQQYTTFYNGFGPGWGWRRGWGGGGFGDTTTTISDIPVGTLVIDLYGGDHQLLFRGMASDELSKNSDKNTGKLDKAIDKIFKKLPVKTQNG